MTAILEIGDVLAIDSQGFIINPCSFAKISPPWTELITDLKAAYLEISETNYIVYIYEVLFPEEKQFREFLILTV